MLMPIKHDPINWPAIIADLIRGGFTIATIAASIGIPPSTVGGWRNVGAEPHYEGGECLVMLWCHATRQDRISAPTTTRIRKPTGFRRTTWIQLHFIDGSH